MLSGLYIFCLLAGSVLTPAPQLSTSTASLGDCTDKRERCIESCGKQREACDRNTPNDPRCVSQQNQCEAGCNNAWKRCQESSALKMISRLAF